MDDADETNGSSDEKRMKTQSAELIGIIAIACTVGFIVAVTALYSGAPCWSALVLYSGVGCLATIMLSIYRAFL